MGKSTKALGRMERNTDKDSAFGVLETDTKVITLKITEKDSESTFGLQVAEGLKELGNKG